MAQGKWGTGPDEFGRRLEADCQNKDAFACVYGPAAMDVDKRNLIFIFDAINWRVKVYDKDGRPTSIINLEKPAVPEGGMPMIYGGGDWLRIGSDGAIYTRTHYGPLAVIRKFDHSGKLLSLYIDKWPSTDFQYAEYKKYLEELKKKNLLKIVPDLSMKTFFPREYFYVEGYTDDSLYGLIRSYSNRKQEVWFYKYLSETSDKLYEKLGPATMAKYSRNLMVVTTDYKILLAIPFKEEVTVFDALGEDNKGNIFVYVYRRPAGGWIQKFNSDGKLVAEIKATQLAKGWGWYPAPFISRNGDVYLIDWGDPRSRAGVKLIRFEKITSKN